MQIPNRKLLNPTSILYLVMGVLFIVLIVTVPNYRTMQNASNLFLRNVPLLCVCLGQMIVMVAAGIDLTVGPVLALATAIASELMGLSIGLTVVVVLLAGAMVGVINGLGVTKAKINPFVMTMAMGAIVNGVTLYIRPRAGGYIPKCFSKAVLAQWEAVPVVPIGIFVVIIIAGYILLQKTIYGRHLYATGGNEEAAKLAGIKTHVTTILAYVICAVLASLAGLYMCARIESGDPFIGGAYVLDSIGAVVIGGTALTGGQGTLWGTLFGVIVFGMLGSVFNFLGVSMNWQYVLRGLIVIGVVGLASVWRGKSHE